jgi:pimeloyl-ACP methyl ester carboxylesterase
VVNSKLIVLVPDYRGNPETLKPLRNLLLKSKDLEGSHCLDFSYQESPFSNRDPESIADKLTAEIEDYIQQHPEINEIILAGHSMGSTIVRRSFLDAAGYGSRIDESGVWPDRVKRIVLLGALGRGFVPDKHVDWRMRIWLIPLIGASSFLGIGKMLRSMLRGADYISRLRIDWIRYSTNAGNKPLVVHVLGGNDEIVKKDDVVDLEEFPNSFAVPVPGASHFSVIVPTAQSSFALTRAFTDNFKAEEATQSRHSEPAKNIVILMHGIRDSRKCFRRVADRIKNEDPSTMVIVPSYGYLSARRFLSTTARNQLVPWLVDEISDKLARHPRATISYAGHSNGTYVLGETLKRLPRLQLNNVYLGASVLPTDYPWEEVIDDLQQVKHLRCDMGTEDWPVGVICKGLNELGVQSLGAGGADEFEYGNLDYVAYNRFRGGHGAMLTNSNIDSIARFLLTSQPMNLDTDEESKASGLFGLATKYSSALIVVAICLVLLSAAAICLIGPASYSIAASALFVLFIWFVLGRF